MNIPATTQASFLIFALIFTSNIEARGNPNINHEPGDCACAIAIVALETATNYYLTNTETLTRKLDAADSKCSYEKWDDAIQKIGDYEIKIFDVYAKVISPPSLDAGYNTLIRLSMDVKDCLEEQKI